MRRLRAALVAALALSVPAVAAGQEPDDADTKGREGQEVELEEDAPPEDMEGTAENPDAPRLPFEEEQADEPEAPAPVLTGYPIEEVRRPITLPAVTSEVGLEVGSRFDPVDLEMALRARYGVTRQWQVGVRYLIGGVYDADGDMGPDSSGFNTGKAFGVDVSYLVFDWMAAKITLPFYVDPFAMGVTLGAPMKFRIGDRFAIVALDDFLDIRTSRFIPSLKSEWENEALVAADEVGTILPNGNIHLRVGAIFQQSPQLAVRGNITQTLEDFGDDDNPTGVELIGQYSINEDFVLAGRAGIDALDQSSSTFGILVFGQYRI